MKVVEFRIEGVAQAKERARVSGRSFYTPSRTSAYEGEVGRSFVAASPFLPEETSTYRGPVALCVTEYRRIPNSWPQWRRNEALRGAQYPITRPDIDNVLKSIKDGLKGIAYHDDSQVTDVSIAKRYVRTPEDNQPYCDVAVQYLNDLEVK